MRSSRHAKPFRKALSFIAASLWVFGAPPAATGQSPETVPIDAFASLPSFSQMKLSPSGHKIGYVIEIDGRKAILIQTLDGSEKPEYFRPPEEGDFDTFYWANDTYIILRLSGTLNRREFRGVSHETRLYTYDTTKKEARWIGKPKRDQKYASQHERVVDFLPDDPDHILVQMDFELDGMSTVYKYKLKSGRRKMVRGNKYGIQHWYTDQNSEIRYGAGYAGSKFKSRYRNADGDWIDLEKTDWNTYLNFEDFSSTADVIYASGRTKHGTDGIYKLDITSGEVIEAVFAHEEVDIDGMTHDPRTGKINGVTYTTDFSRAHYFDEDMAIIQRSLEKVLPDMVVSIVNRAANAERYVILVESDQDPGTYYIYDRDQKNLIFFAKSREAIDSALMAQVAYKMAPVRDGSEIPVFLTKPNGVETSSLPTIIMPHGGPHARDTRHWDYWSQFYASRGYLVVQPNFRGSTGYGDAFRIKGRHQWGGLMQDDVTDVTKWVIAEGMADPERICIVGASYGGYAALMGPIKEPDLYKCAVSVNGVTDLKRLKREDKNTIGGRSWIKTMGLEGVDDDEVSPHHRAEEINIPVMIMASVDDARVNYKMSRATHKKLQKLGKDSSYVEIEDGTHHMVTKAARMVKLKESEKFLAKHIGPGTTPARVASAH